MIFNQKEHPKLFWVEGLVYLAIVAVCMLGSFGVFDAKAQLTELPDPQVIQEPLAVGTCEAWVELPPALRIQILRYGMISELTKSELKEGTQSLIDCLSEYNNMQDLDKIVVNDCRRGEEEFLTGVFDKSLERMVFRCLKWVNGEENETRKDRKGT